MGGQEYRVAISAAALTMLDSHVDFLARSSKSAATRLMDEILGDIASLDHNPERYPMYESPFIADGRYHRMVSGKRYLVLYEIGDTAVFVDYIVDCRQDYQSGRLPSPRLVAEASERPSVLNDFRCSLQS
jgi:plasmid stabilization system protein ParE